MFVLFVMSRFCFLEIFRFRFLIKGLLEEGVEMKIRLRRKVVFVGFVVGYFGVLGLEKGGVCGR